MNLDVKVTRTITITQEEFEAECRYVAENGRTVHNSFLGTYSEMSVEAFIRAVSFHLFNQGDSDA